MIESAPVRLPFEGTPLALGIALVGAILAGCVFYSPIPLLVVAGVVASFYFITRPYQLLLVMVFLIPFNFVFKVGPIPVAAELLKVFAWIPFLVHFNRRNGPFKTSRYNWCFAVLAGLLLLSVFRAHDLPFTAKESLRLGSNIGLCYLAVNLVDSREKVLQIFRVLVYSAFLVACYGFYQFAIRDFGALWWIVNPRLETSLAHGRETFWEWRDRMTSVLTSEMELGHYFNLCLPIGILLWLTEGRRRVSSKWLLMSVAMLTGLLLTFTFGSWVAIAATIGLFAMFFDKAQRWKILFGEALLFLLLATVLNTAPFRPLIADKAGQIAWDAATRLDSWTLALMAFRSHPVVGIGYGNFPSMTVGMLRWLPGDLAPEGSSPHDVYLYILSELGLLGLVAMVFIFLSTVRANLRIRGTPGLKYIGLALAFALTAAFIGGFSDDSTLYGPHASYLVWLFIGLSEAVSRLPRTETSALIDGVP